MKSDRCILKKCAAILALTVLVAFSTTACTKIEQPMGSITMTTTASEVSFSVAGIEDINIDWGDGKKSNINDAFFFDELFERFWFTQEYSGTTAHNIVITGNVTRLTCVNIGLIILDVSRNTVLTDLDCSKNQLTALDVSRNTALTSLACNNNPLTALDVSKNTALERLRCDYNQITSLDVSKNTALTLLSCACNQLTAPALNDLFRTLPYYPGLEYGKGGDICISTRNPGPIDNPGTFDCDRSIAEEKGWVFMTIR